MRTRAVIQIDNRDDRREIHRLLAQLSPDMRVRFLAACCRGARFHGKGLLAPRLRPETWQRAAWARTDSAQDECLTLECFFDLVHLANNFSLDLGSVLARLEQLARRA
jgi:hypothetical protein